MATIQQVEAADEATLDRALDRILTAERVAAVFHSERVTDT